MSETNNKQKNPAIACGDVTVEQEGIKIQQGNYGPSKHEIINLAGMEIKVESYELIFDEKSGKVLRIKDNRTIGEVIDDRRRRKIIGAMNKKRKEEIEHE